MDSFDYLGKTMKDIKELEIRIQKAHKILDDIGIPKWNPNGEKYEIHERLSVHVEQIRDHLVSLEGLLEGYRR